MQETILVIEDDRSFRTALKTFLADEGYAVLEAGDAAGAMDLFDRNRPDLVLLDLGIPDGDGLHTLTDLKQRSPGTPVVIVSGRTHIGAAIEAFKAGAFDYVTKPIDSMDVFLNVVRNSLTQSRLTRRVQETQDHLLRLIQNLPVIIFIINRDMEFEFLNDTTREVLGFSPLEIQESPRRFLKRIMPEDRGAFLDAVRKGFESGSENIRLEFRFRHKMGYEVALRLQSISDTRHNGDAPGHMEGMIQDVTHSSYMNKVLLQNERLNMLRGITEEVAHEIRNPLVSLGGFARQLQARFPEASETGVILEECGRLERLVQRIGAYLEPLEAKLTRCRLPAVLDFVLRLLSIRLEHTSVTCRCEFDPGLPPVLADEDFLHRVFIHLIGHGIDTVGRGQTIRITADRSNGFVRVSLNLGAGPGDPLDNYRLFTPFDEEEMNLAMCSRLVERMGGHLILDRSGPDALLILSIPVYAELRDDHKDPTI
jgi:PAS domain S-box-containing protein